jgi:hypothetical protein
VMPRQKRPWTLKEFKSAHPDFADDVLRPLLKIYNTAIANGLTRDEVLDTAKRLAEDAGPEGVPPADLLAALVSRAYPVSEDERRAFGAPDAARLVRGGIDTAAADAAGGKIGS